VKLHSNLSYKPSITRVL